MKITIDAMGGDNAPKAQVLGSDESCRGFFRCGNYLDRQ